jgi:hypothetical protein
MRVFADTALVRHLKDAGFTNMKVHRAADLVHGIWSPEPWAFPNISPENQRSWKYTIDYTFLEYQPAKIATSSI